MAATLVGPVLINAGAPGATLAALNITAAVALKTVPGLLVSVCVNVVGSSGNLTLNDCATTGAAAAANQIVSIAFGSLTVGQVITLNWPCGTGIVVSAVPSAGVYAVSYS